MGSDLGEEASQQAAANQEQGVQQEPEDMSESKQAGR